MRRTRLTDFAAGLVAVVLVAVGVFFAFSKANPFADPYELSALFRDAQNLKPGSPVRTAGVDVGTVSKVEAVDDGSGAAEVFMEIDDAGLPIHEDAELQVIPRLFLEGNFTIELKPGSPSAPEVDSGATISLDRTANSVSFDQIAAVLDKDTRQSLQTLLDDYSTAFDEGGAEAFRDSIPFWREAYRTTALATDALLGQEEGDLARVLRGQQRTFAALAEDRDALRGLVTNLNLTTAAFAREDDALRASIPELRDVLRVGMPALDSVNGALPSLRAFARDALPGVRSADPTLEVAQPFVEQLSRLVGEDELQGVARELRRAIPPLAELSEANIRFLGENRALASCTADVLVPFAETPIPDPDFPEASNQPFFKESGRAFVGLAGESRTGDANGQWFRVNASSSGTNLLQLDGPLTDTLFASPLFQPLGVRPVRPAERPQFRPDVPCETQEPPNLEGQSGSAGTTTTMSAGAEPTAAVTEVRTELRQLQEFIAGERERSPLDYRGAREEEQR
ncbi:MAG: MlaD family protein [Thermoleophilaceae bacterium]